MPASNALVEQRQEYAAKQKTLEEVFELAKDGAKLDFSRPAVLEKLGATGARDAADKVKARNDELHVLGENLRAAELKAIRDENVERKEELERPAPHRHPGQDGDQVKTFGQLYVDSKEWKQSQSTKTTVPGIVDISIKALFSTTAGFAPESVRSGVVIPAATRPILVLDLFPSGPLNQAVEKYMEQTVLTPGAAERAEGAAFGESTITYAEKTSDVRYVGDSIPVTDEQLEDEAQVSGLLDQQLRFNVRQRADLQVLVGNGTAPNLRGVNNVVGIQTQAKGTDNGIVAFARALTKIRFTGRAIPSGAIFHPNDWLDILLTPNTNGDFLFGNPFMGPGPQSLFGVSVAQSDAQTENTGLVGDFTNFSRIGERRGVEVRIGFVGTQFTEGKSTIRASLRMALTVYRPAAFCQLTGI